MGGWHKFSPSLDGKEGGKAGEGKKEKNLRANAGQINRMRVKKRRAGARR